MNREFLNPVASVIAQNMEKYADKTAVKIKGEEISYAVLDKIANDIFDKLTNAINQTQDSSNHAFSHDIKVGVYLPRDRYLIPAIWAIIKAGYTYVPLDTETPIERLKFIVKDCGVTVVLCENYFIGILDDVLTVDVLSTPNYIQKWKAISEKVNEIAYVIYTSGTTGKPKGVPISYYSLSNLLQVVSLPENFNISEKAIILCFASINFDASILDIMASLYYGATIILADEAQRRDIKQLYHLIEKENVTIATFPPSLVTLMPDFDFQAMDTLVVAGEKMLPSIIRKVSSAHYRLINAYGPTENTVMSTMREITSEMACENIGKTIPGVVGHVLRSDLTSVEVGEIGELCLGGIQLTSGYLHRPELNQEKFIKNPFDDKSEAPVLYKTGDLVRLMEDGSYDFYKKNFDWMNTDWQYNAMVITPDYNKNIASIQCHYSYAYNHGTMYYTDPTLCECSFEKKTYVDDKVDTIESSHSKWITKYFYDEEDRVTEVSYIDSTNTNNTYTNKMYYNKNGVVYKQIDYKGIVTEKVFNDNGMEVLTKSYHTSHPAEVFYTES